MLQLPNIENGLLTMIHFKITTNARILLIFFEFKHGQVDQMTTTGPLMVMH